MTVNILQLATKQRNIILPTTALIAAIVSGNAECQSKVRLLGGLRALINLLRQHVELKEPADQDVSFIEHVVDTIGSAIGGHAICLDSAADLGLVSLLIQCIDLSHTPGVDDAVAKQFRTKCILALSICVDQCERNQQQLRDREGLELLIELLTQEQSEEFRRVAIFVLHCLTVKSQVAGGRKSRREFDEIGEQSRIQRNAEIDFSQVTTPTRDAETQTDYQETLSVCTTAGQCSTDTRERIPTGEVTQETLSVCTTGGQCRTNTRERVPTGEMTQESSPSSRKAIQRKKRFVTSCKVLTPLTRSKTAQSKTTGVEPTAKRKLNSAATRGCVPSSRDSTDCEACENVVNSKNFVKTLRNSSNLCSYHRELDQFLRQKIYDVKRRKIIR